MEYILNHPDRMLELILQHLEIVVIAVVLALLIGIPLGIVVTRVRWLEPPVTGIAGVLYTIPSLALFAVLIPFTGLSATTAITALTLYSLLVIIRNTAAAIDSVDPAMEDAAKGVGMTNVQRLFFVELPLGVPVILAGVRVAVVSAVGIAAIAAYIGAGGLGLLIFEGIRTTDPDRIIAGAFMASLLALSADFGLKRLEATLRRDRPTQL
ncbi:MAG TPA: ABC transporter permease [Chloroflexia bacterium]|nr:ABC transporter permease [Chloroflexia bacterium]